MHLNSNSSIPGLILWSPLRAPPVHACWLCMGEHQSAHFISWEF